MLKVGITGGIGSGKSTVCKLFELLGVQVYYADERAKFLLHHNTDVREQVEANFGNHLYNNGELNRKALAAIVFNNKERLEVLNSIVHPAVNKDFSEWLKKVHKAPYVLKEAALLFETGSAARLNYIITVSAPEELRIKRIMQRDNATEDEIKARIENQMPAEKKESMSDFVITNNEKHLLIPQVVQLNKILVGKLREC